MVDVAADDPFHDRTFEQLVGELETVARQMESSELGIEAAADLYGRAAVLYGAANARLARVQQRLAELRDREDR